METPTANVKTELVALEQKGILLARSHLSIIAVALVAILSLGYVAFRLYVQGIQAEAALKTTLALKESENKQLEKDKEHIQADADAKVQSLEQQRKTIRTPKQAVSVLSDILPPTPSDPFPVTTREIAAADPAHPEAVGTLTELSPEAVMRLADRELVCRETEVKLTACSASLAIQERLTANKQDELTAALKVKKPGFFARLKTVTKIALPAVAIGYVLRVIFSHSSSTGRLSVAH